MPKHYIITNRLITQKGNAKDYYKVNDEEYLRKDGDEEAQDEIRYGTVEFSKSKNTKFDIEIYKDPDEKEMEKHFKNEKSAKKLVFGSEIIFDKLYESGSKAKHREDILVFIHGFKSDLDTALKSMQKLHHEYVENPDSPIAHIVMFTWPARKKLLKYRDDARDAKLTGYALARSLAKLRDLYSRYFVEERKKLCSQKVHLMCHSMGNRVLESMFVEIEHMQNQINNMFGEIFLVGADIDYDAIHEPKPLSKIIDLGERVHIYYHNKDAALGISELTKNAFNRLGRWGAKNSLKLSDGIFQADVTDIEDEEGFDDKLIHHWYHFSSQSVVDDIIDVLNGKSSIFSAQF